MNVRRSLYIKWPVTLDTEEELLLDLVNANKVKLGRDTDGNCSSVKLTPPEF
jgi:hypothetical protein